MHNQTHMTEYISERSSNEYRDDIWSPKYRFVFPLHTSCLGIDLIYLSKNPVSMRSSQYNNNNSY